jgi:pilus assembly protein CpaB
MLLSLLVGIGTYSYLLTYQSRVESENSLSSVYVAKQEIPQGTSLAEIKDQTLLEIRRLPLKALPIDALTPNSNLDVNLKTRGPLSSGQILVANYFSADTNPEVGLAIPKGMFAIAISLDDVARVGNFVAPGARVAVFSTATDRSGSVQTKVLLNEALVLSVGSQTLQMTNGALATASPIVTVALSPSDAQKLLLASKTSELTFALAYENNPNALIGKNLDASKQIESGS